MYQKVKFSLMVLFFVVLLLGAANAGPVAVISPNGGEDLTSGQVWNVQVSIDYESLWYKPAKYRLSYWCRDPEVSKSWKMITDRYCSALGCPTSYLWEVPSVERYADADDIRDCKVRVQLYNANGAATAKDVSDSLFKIHPYVPIDNR